MLAELTVDDFALIERLKLTFSPELNVITGETGAGKSILVGALGTLMGMRTGPDMIRTGAERTVVEARFALPPSHPAVAMIHDLGGDVDDGEVILRREVTSDGHTRAWIGGASVPVRTLRSVGERLVDFHGQHEHQLLLSAAEHRAILDDFAGDGEVLAAVRERGTALRGLRQEREDLVRRQHEVALRRDMIEFERKELEDISPRPGEIEELDAERKVLENVERLGGLLAELSHLLAEADDSVLTRLGSGRRRLQEAIEIDGALGEEVVDDYEQMLVLAQELGTRLSERLTSLEADPVRLEQVQDRLAVLRRLIRRYGGIDQAVERRRELEQVIEDDAGIADRIAAAEARIIEAHARFAEAVAALSEARRRAAETMSRQITASLSSLGMARARLEVRLTRGPADGVDPIVSDAVLLDGEPCNAGPDGAEEVELLISPNLGEPLRPLVRIASGGEISRTMLAIKSVLAEHDPVATMVFDEIDQGISGRIAEAVGERMRQLARHRQIIAITHLPQIAAWADQHIAVRKREGKGRTVTIAEILSHEERTRALAELLGGAQVTELALEHARAMLEEHR